MKSNGLRYSYRYPVSFIFKSLVVAVFLLFNCLLLFSQSIDNLNIEKVQDEGLTNSYITSFQQDKNGFIWVGSGEGVFRYDGYSFKAFRCIPGDEATLASNRVTRLYTISDKVWVGMSTGLGCIDINTLAVKNIPSFKSLEINSIVPRDNSSLWIATSTGLYLFNENDYSCKLIPAVARTKPVTDLVDDQKGHLFLTSFDGIYCYTIKTGKYKFYPVDLPTYPEHDKNAHLSLGKVVLDHNGNLWVCTWDAGLLRFNIKTGKTTTWFHPTDDVSFLPYKIVMSILPDNSGNLWLANKEGGLTIFNLSQNKFINYPVEWKGENKISGPVLTLFRDKSGIVWIGTENGIFKYDPHHIHLSKKDLFLKTNSGLTPAHISPLVMCKDKDGLWWMGMYEGVFTYDEKTGALTDCNAAVGLKTELGFACFNITQDAAGAIWITARSLLIKVTKKSKLSFQTETFKSDEVKSTIYKLYIDNENRIWLGTVGNGVFRFDPLTKKFISYPDRTAASDTRVNRISAFCELSKDSILIGGYQTGLLILHPASGKYQKITVANSKGMEAAFTVDCIYKSGEDLWIGTENNGFLQCNDRLKKFFNLTISDGLPSMSVSLVTGDKHDNIWLLTGSGVVRFEKRDKKITVFDKRDGIQNFALAAMVVDSANNVSFGCRGAIYTFNPAAIVKNEAPPEVSITDLRVFDKDYTIRKGEGVELNYNQNYFTFEFVGLNYTQSRLNKYAYKMAGLDKKWNNAGTRRYVSYANLEEGTYTFYVRACNNEGVWNNIPAKLTLIINPPFWHRWWFYTICALLIASSIYLLYWYNMNQLKMRLRLRNKIARDLHDDIGSTLSGINIFSKIALQKLRRDEAGSTELLEKISDRSEKTMDALSDIVWSISTKNDNIDNFLVKAREYLAEILEPQGIKYILQADDDTSHLKLGMEERKELYLIFKEAICNASKYAECSRVFIYLEKEKDVFKLTIRDDGRGFDTTAISHGNGLMNMQHRAEKINAKLEIKSKPNEGTAIFLSFYITRFRQKKIYKYPIHLGGR